MIGGGIEQYNDDAQLNLYQIKFSICFHAIKIPSRYSNYNHKKNNALFPFNDVHQKLITNFPFNSK